MILNNLYPNLDYIFHYYTTFFDLFSRKFYFCIKGDGLSEIDFLPVLTWATN